LISFSPNSSLEELFELRPNVCRAEERMPGFSLKDNKTASSSVSSVEFRR